MGKSLSKLIGWLLWLSSTALNLAKFSLWAIGTSTVLEDAALLPGKVRAVLAFVEAQPGWAFYGVFGALTILGLWLAFSPPVKRESAPEASPVPQPVSQNVISVGQSGGVTAHSVNYEGDDEGRR